MHWIHLSFSWQVVLVYCDPRLLHVRWFVSLFPGSLLPVSFFRTFLVLCFCTSTFFFRQNLILIYTCEIHLSLDYSGAQPMQNWEATKPQNSCKREICCKLVPHNWSAASKNVKSKCTYSFVSPKVRRHNRGTLPHVFQEVLVTSDLVHHHQSHPLVAWLVRVLFNITRGASCLPWPYPQRRLANFLSALEWLA